MTLGLVAAALAAATPASAATSKAAYSWHVADQLLEDAVGSPPVAIAAAPNGDTIELDGTGVMDVAAKTASGGGAVTHKNATGAVLATGTFQATRLTSFQFYGCQDLGLGVPLCGGLAKLEVTIHVDGTNLSFPSILSIDCLIGDKIPAGADTPARHEGIKLNVKDVINFNHTHHSGFTVFIPQ
ncbi:MAG: hypothetical protein ACRDH5_08420 [bacterium]